VKPVIIVHHSEITLKGENRGFFEKQLMRNTQRTLHDLLPAAVISGGYGRFVVSLPEEFANNADGKWKDEAVRRLSDVFGIANICVGVEVAQDLEVFSRTAEGLLEGLTFQTLRVETRRVDKNFPIHSMEVNARVGEHLCRRFGVRANLSRPDETIFIEIVNKVAYVYRLKIKGAGGLPVGVSGKVTALLSAGFDSPVACYYLMKRGATVTFVHFHSFPYVTRDSVDQVKQLVKLLTKFQFDSRLYVIPFGEVQQEIVARTAPPLRVILYRRVMVRVAEEITSKEHAQAVVTGESLGQVASQTLRNMRVINDVAKLPILRPLVGMDKEEIIAIARKIGTYDISKEPYDDCCSFLAPRRPETWSDPKAVEVAEATLDIPRLISLCIEKGSVERFSFLEDVKKATA